VQPILRNSGVCRLTDRIPTDWIPRAAHHRIRFTGVLELAAWGVADREESRHFVPTIFDLFHFPALANLANHEPQKISLDILG
jgi:hypothetical protein